MAAPAPPVAADPARTADPSAYSGPDVGAESGSKQEEKLLYTFETLAQHNTREELWMLLHDKVYDVTAFMDEVSCSSVFFAGEVPSFFAQLQGIGRGSAVQVEWRLMDVLLAPRWR